MKEGHFGDVLERQGDDSPAGREEEKLIAGEKRAAGRQVTSAAHQDDGFGSHHRPLEEPRVRLLAPELVEAQQRRVDDGEEQGNPQGRRQPGRRKPCPRPGIEDGGGARTGQKEQGPEQTPEERHFFYRPEKNVTRNLCIQASDVKGLMVVLPVVPPLGRRMGVRI